MNESLALAPDLYVTPTPLGALHVVTTDADGPAERLVRHLLRTPKPCTTATLDLAAATGVDDETTAITVVALAQDAGWIEGRTDAPEVADGPLGHELPELLTPLSDIGRAALIDDQGFSLSAVGFSPEAEEEVTVLAAEVSRLQQRREMVAAANTAATGWGLVDRHGATTVAFFPLAIGRQQFVLILGGLPRLNHAALVLLTAALSRRYDPSPDGPAGLDGEASTHPTTTEGSTHA